MALRASLPAEAVTITPGYTWRLDLDITFNGERPTDWPDWILRMHVWGDGVAFKLEPGDGVWFEQVPDIVDAGSPAIVPIIEMSAARTELLRDGRNLHYLIDMTAPGGVSEDYFSGPLKVLYAPPRELIE